MRNFWDNWELRVLVLLSLTLQLSLLYFGRRRRYKVETWIHIFLWFCYLVADSVATVALGVISCKQGNSCSYDGNDSQVQNDIMAFWAPFMLLHLGGQDTITAYAVQDNDLWLRHLLKLVVQSSVALYVFRTSWNGNWLSFLTITMLLAGFIKYAERIWVMRSANRTPKFDGHYNMDDQYDAQDNFPRFKPLFLNRKIRYKLRRDNSKKFRRYYFQEAFKKFERYDYQEAFQMIEIELGHAYDTFYTKIPLFFTAWGCFFRCISISATIFTFVFFLVKERQEHLQTDLIITYILLSGAVVFEICAVILLIGSDVGRLWLEVYVPLSGLKISSDQFFAIKRWSKSVGQLNMLSFCVKYKPGISLGTPKSFADLRVLFFNYFLPKQTRKLQMMFYCMTNKKVSDELKRLVWNNFFEKSNLRKPGFSEDYNKYISGHEHQSVELEIYQSIIIWHIATDLCFYSDNDNNVGIPAERQVFKDILIRKRVIKEISDYMMYLLSMCPFMLSTGNTKISFWKACELLGEALKNFTGSSMSLIACKEIMSYVSNQEKDSDFEEYDSNQPDSMDDDHRSDSEDDDHRLDSLLLYYAVLVAKNLRGNEQKWEILTRFWIENLGYVATLCQGKNHAKQLLRGGEFLTHVWFLIEHLDLKKSFRKPPTRPQEEEQIAG